MPPPDRPVGKAMEVFSLLVIGVGGSLGAVPPLPLQVVLCAMGKQAEQEERKGGEGRTEGA